MNPVSAGPVIRAGKVPEFHGWLRRTLANNGVITVEDWNQAVKEWSE